ncbi:MAG: SpoIIE family protein phosphatase [Thalassobaculaceae bacterium]|nr:SpoIIE family protein phosphatase [Thalassobaculaceae bacterium]
MRTFRARLILLGGGLAVFSVLLTTAFQTWHARQDLIHATEIQGEEIGRLLGHGAQATLLAESGGPSLSIHDLIDDLLSGEQVQAAWILDQDGKEIAVGHGTTHAAELTGEDRARIEAIDGMTVSYFTETALTIVTPSSSLNGGGDWTVLLRIDRSELDSSLRSEILIGLAVFLVVALAAFLLMSQIAGWLSAPLADITAAAAAMETRTYTPEMLRRVTARKDELGRLAETFAGMAREVLGREEILEGLVRERTSELNEKNLQLEAANARVAEELRITQRMQISILPTQALEMDGARVFARMIPAREVGGDFYDFMNIDDHRIAVVIGDVSGKGVPAAFFMAVARTVLRRLALAGGAPGETLASANDELCEVNPLELFVTAFVGILDRRDGSFVYANAGHNPPCLISRDGEVTFLERTGGMALGVMPDLPQGERSITIAPGEAVFLYTDGVTEAFDANGVQFEEERMLAVLKQKVAGETLVERMINAVERFSDGAERSDDVTVLSLDRTASEAPDTTVGAPVPDPAAAETTLVIIVANRSEELGRLAETVGRFAEENELSPRAAMQLDMAIEEIVSNVIKYGFDTGDVREDAVELSLKLTAGRLAIRVADRGRPFDPLADAPEPDIGASVEDRPIGGLGVHLVKTVMADLRYTRDDDRNVLDMVLDLTPPT